MKLQRLLGAISAVMLSASVAFAAEQASYVAPGSGPMSMATFVTSYLNPAMRALAACHNGSSTPANGPGGVPMAYQEWCDTTSNPAIIKRYDGSSWVAVGSLNTSTHAWVPYLTGGISGGVPYFSSGGVMASSAALTQNGFVVGGGAGAAPIAIAACTDDQIAFGRSSNSPLCRTVTGDITFASGVAAIGANKVTNSMLRQSGALTVVGRSANSSGNVADIQATASSEGVLRESGGALGFGTVATGGIADNAVTNAKLATMAANTTKCNATAGSAVPSDCNASTMRAVIGAVIGTNVEAWDADLDCLAALSSTGMIKRTGSGTCTAGTMALSDLATGTQDTVIGYFGSTTASAVSIGNCSNALTYSTSTHSFGCNSTAGTGTVTNVGTSGLATGGPIASAGTVTVTAAVKSDQTAASSTSVAITPGVQQYHPSAVKAWAKFTGSTSNGNQTIGDSFNITSIARTSAGNYTVTFTTAFANANYACTAASYAAGAANAFANFSSAATGSINVNYVNISGPSAYDPTLGASINCEGTQ